MNDRTTVTLLLCALLSLYPARISSLDEKDGEPYKDHDLLVFNVTTTITDDVKESIFTIKLRCHYRTEDTIACQLNDPQYQTIYRSSPCDKSVDLCTREHLQADNSYVGRFEMIYRGSSILRLIVSSETSLKQLTFYRVMAELLNPSINVTSLAEGTYTLFEESIYGKCKSLVKIVRFKMKDEEVVNSGALRMIAVPPVFSENETSGKNRRKIGEMIRLEKTRYLETCHPIPGLLVFDAFFYHPMMTSIHYDIKKSVSRLIMWDRGVKSSIFDQIEMKNIEKPAGNTTLLHVRSIVTLSSMEKIEKPIPRIVDPIVVKLPFVDEFVPVKKHNDTDHPVANDTSKMPQ